MRIKCSILFLLTVSILLFSSCGLKESYKEFHIKKIDDLNEDEYFIAEGLDFATIDGVVIEPEIREVQYDRYRIYISAHSLTGSEQVTINKIVVKDAQKEYYKNMEKKIVVYEKEEDAFKGTCNVGEFVLSEDDFLEIKELQVYVEVQVENEGREEVKEMLYDVEIMHYMSTKISL